MTKAGGMWPGSNAHRRIGILARRAPCGRRLRLLAAPPMSRPRSASSRFALGLRVPCAPHSTVGPSGWRRGRCPLIHEPRHVPQQVDGSAVADAQAGPLAVPVKLPLADDDPQGRRVQQLDELRGPKMARVNHHGRTSPSPARRRSAPHSACHRSSAGPPAATSESSTSAAIAWPPAALSSRAASATDSAVGFTRSR